jgi:integrase
MRLHSLRHSAAVGMLDVMGGDLRAVSAVLGHATIAVTIDVYGQEADDARRRAAEAMDRALGKRSEGAR